MTDPSDLLQRLVNVPSMGGEPVFKEPWEAQAFAITVQLHEAGHFSWPTWAETLTREINRAQGDGDPDDGSTYYEHWLAALESLVIENKLSDADELQTRKDAWDRAVRNTPHGKPIELSNA